MIKIVTFRQLSDRSYLFNFKKVLDGREFGFSYFSNNVRTGDKKSESEISQGLKNADLIIYQPLGDKYKQLSEQNIRNNKIYRGITKISLPYIFNSGVYSLCYAPLMNVNKYGYIFGEDEFIKLLHLGIKKEEILFRYKNKLINFNLKKGLIPR